MPKSIAEQLYEVILEQLKGIREALSRLETTVDAVRMGEITELRGKLAALELTLSNRIGVVDTAVQILSSQAKRSGATWGAFVSAVISLVVAAAGALLLKR